MYRMDVKFAAHGVAMYPVGAVGHLSRDVKLPIFLTDGVR